ncbi:MAG: hypothetical protein V2I67_11390, partial [Thermoanaerobaculales bacterium]|nr:hypothetical protein [Thermoanaerobaculales bacterium]
MLVSVDDMEVLCSYFPMPFFRSATVSLILEGDERVHLDGSRHPAHYGTGVEALFEDEPPAAPPATEGFTESSWELWAGFPPGTCDLVLDGRCDAGDVAEAVRLV